jgi:regulator of cell morphogenesis and NO signaling
MSTIRQKLINQIVDENYIHASVLNFFGISFYNYSDKTLEQVCLEKGLNVDVVSKKLEAINIEKPEENLALHKYPVDLIIEYLKHSHHLFVKHKLPYISNLILNLDNSRIDKSIKDLKFIFPFFVEDFIKHIYEEEDTLFTYILTLYNSLSINKKPNIAKLYYAMEKHSIRDYALRHSNDDHEMQGLRNMTNNYILNDPSDMHLKVIYAELNSFESELSRHAQIENEILFPKALSLENEVSFKIKNFISSN